MTQDHTGRAKFDDDLLRLLGEGFAADAEFPMVVTARSEKLGAVVELVQATVGTSPPSLPDLVIASTECWR